MVTLRVQVVEQKQEHITIKDHMGFVLLDL